jgi:phage antirepressor YoqD-like protein
MDWAWDTLDGLRRGTISAPTISLDPSEVAQLETENEVYRQKIQVFEEHCPAKFYDLDEVAALMQFYVKPPFGRNHLKRWLTDHKILCMQAFKNDKPIQGYIDRGWFVAVIHEWFRKGKKHTENRFYMTPRGVMGIVDIAIREKLMTLPAPRNACLPGLYE